jgi:sterol desaturase/sphingolipid hydroxylase (fatty acid hydroxylase superfamily)
LDFADLKLPLLALSIAAFWLAEQLAPHFAAFIRDARARRLHGMRNALLAILNGVLGILILGAAIAGSMLLAEKMGFGLLRLVGWQWGLELILALILFDCWMYWWHRINHEIPFLWRFHRVHHSDPRMDVTTALRFHPGEIILSTIARLLVVNLIGMEIWHLALYELIALPIVAFHHSNIALSRRADDALRWLMVTPWMHWVHHSRLRPETNSNYASILSVWDRLFRTYKFREDPSSIDFGLDEYPDTDEHQAIVPLLATPARPNASPKQSTTRRAEDSLTDDAIPQNTGR